MVKGARKSGVSSSPQFPPSDDEYLDGVRERELKEWQIWLKEYFQAFPSPQLIPSQVKGQATSSMSIEQEFKYHLHLYKKMKAKYWASDLKDTSDDDDDDDDSDIGDKKDISGGAKLKLTSCSQVASGAKPKEDDDQDDDNEMEQGEVKKVKMMKVQYRSSQKPGTFWYASYPILPKKPAGCRVNVNDGEEEDEDDDDEIHDSDDDQQAMAEYYASLLDQEE